jgi:predicted lysophospholipase L1 biosynthesis ABC-type transport system permease subunit
VFVLTSVRQRFWIEAALGAVTAVMAVVTAVVPDWIEEVFNVDPDGGNGALEWAIVVVLLACAAGFSIAARHEWRRGRAAAGQS